MWLTGLKAPTLLVMLLTATVLLQFLEETGRKAPTNFVGDAFDSDGVVAVSGRGE